MTPVPASDVGEVVGEVRRRLAELADPSRAPAMQGYMRSALPFHGVAMPVLRRACTAVFDAHPLPGEPAWREAVLDLWDGAAFREERYAAIELTRHRRYRPFQHPGTLGLYRHLVVTGAWWDLVDGIASRGVGPILRTFPGEVTPVVRSWAVDADLWLRRTAILAQLDSKQQTDTELLTEVLEANLEGSLHGHEFFIRKAVGWALRQHARVDPGWVRAFVDDHAERMAGLSRREALKHLL